MKFLVDVCAGRRLAEWLSAEGHDVQAVRDRDPHLTDEDILAWATVEERIVITIDKDFGTLAVALGQPHFGIVRLPDVPSPERISLMDQVISKHEKELDERALITVSRGQIRIRRA